MLVLLSIDNIKRDDVCDPAGLSLGFVELKFVSGSLPLGNGIYLKYNGIEDRKINAR